MMKRFLLLLVMILAAALLTSCVASFKPTETPCPTSGTLEFELVNTFLGFTLDEMKEADDCSLTGSVTIYRAEDKAVVATIPAQDIHLMTYMMDDVTPQNSNLTAVVPYQDLALNVEYGMDCSDLSVNLVKNGRIMKTTVVSVPPDTQDLFTPTVLPTPDVPVTGDGAAPAAWLLLCGLCAAALPLMLRRRAR